jgi:Mannosyltransferase (PIG-V)
VLTRNPPDEPRPDEIRPVPRAETRAHRRATRVRTADPLTREVLGWWAVTRLAVLMVALSAPLLFNRTEDYPNVWQAWKQWDIWHFEAIARYGYDPSQPSGAPLAAFFPGLPLLMHVIGWAGIPPVAAGMLVSLVASAFAGVYLARLAEHEFGAEVSGPRTALLWYAAPVGVFLAAAYTESLFCALAFPAWLAARQGRWQRAAILVACACTVRVSGIFLVFALLVEFVTSKQRDWKQAGWLLLPAVPLFAFMAYLKHVYGNWLAWQHAQAQGWQREFTWPWIALQNTIEAAGSKHFGPDRTDWTWMFRGELIALAVGFGLLVWLLVRRSWGEAAWVGSTLAAFATSYWFISLTRATLLWWPLWIGLAVTLQRRPWLGRLYLAIALPLAGLWAASFLTGRWSG